MRADIWWWDHICASAITSQMMMRGAILPRFRAVPNPDPIRIQYVSVPNKTNQQLLLSILANS
jgi:hypothetical protein